jgi:hypothetical protein
MGKGTVQVVPVSLKRISIPLEDFLAIEFTLADGSRLQFSFSPTDQDVIVYVAEGGVPLIIEPRASNQISIRPGRLWMTQDE